MAPHGLQIPASNKNKKPEVINRVTYQVGVDVLGFPTYVEHFITTGKKQASKFNPKKIFWMRVFQSIIKQH
jgi:hypothetical protein